MEQKNSTKPYYQAFFIDLGLLVLLSSPLLIWGFLRHRAFNLGTHKFEPIISVEIDQLINEFTIFYYLIIIGFILTKDVLGLSIGKRLMGIEIINKYTRLPATKLQLLGRNLAWGFIVFELPMKLIFPTARMGDTFFGLTLKLKDDPYKQ